MVNTDQVTFLKIVLRFPWHMLILAGVLVTVGALALYSASEGSWTPWAGRHAVRGGVGAGIMLALAFIDSGFCDYGPIRCSSHRLVFWLPCCLLAVATVLRDGSALAALRSSRPSRQKSL